MTIIEADLKITTTEQEVLDRANELYQKTGFGRINPDLGVPYIRELQDELGWPAGRYTVARALEIIYAEHQVPLVRARQMVGELGPLEILSLEANQLAMVAWLMTAVEEPAWPSRPFAQFCLLSGAVAERHPYAALSPKAAVAAQKADQTRLNRELQEAIAKDPGKLRDLGRLLASFKPGVAKPN